MEDDSDSDMEDDSAAVDVAGGCGCGGDDDDNNDDDNDIVNANLTADATADDNDDGITLNKKDAPTHKLIQNFGDIDGAHLCEGFALQFKEMNELMRDTSKFNTIGQAHTK